MRGQRYTRRQEIGKRTWCRHYYYVQHKADINIKDNERETALHQAVMCDNRIVVWLLLEHGADINIQNQFR